MNNRFSLYWYRSLAETLDTTYINIQGFPTKTLVYFTNNDTYSQYYLTYVVVTLLLLYLLYTISNKEICSILFTICRSLDYPIITHCTNLFKNTVN